MLDNQEKKRSIELHWKFGCQVGWVATWQLVELEPIFLYLPKKWVSPGIMTQEYFPTKSHRNQVPLGYAFIISLAHKASNTCKADSYRCSIRNVTSHTPNRWYNHDLLSIWLKFHQEKFQQNLLIDKLNIFFSIQLTPTTEEQLLENLIHVSVWPREVNAIYKLTKVTSPLLMTGSFSTRHSTMNSSSNWMTQLSFRIYSKTSHL